MGAVMNDLHKITLMAQAAANRANAPMAILNLNLYGKLYVVREWNDCYIGSRELVARVMPAQGE